MKWVKNECPVPVHNCGKAKYWQREALESVIKKVNPRKLSRMQRFAILRSESEVKD